MGQDQIQWPVDLKDYLQLAINQTQHQQNDELKTLGVWYGNGTIVVLIILYSFVIFGGILGNIALIVTLCSQPSGRLRNPLLVALCLADLLVAGVSAPLAIVALAFTQNTWNLPIFSCKAIHFMQSIPVAASTISLFMLSLDRYATVKHPRLAQLRQQRFLPSVLATGAWISAALLSIPILLSYTVVTTVNHENQRYRSYCRPEYGSDELRISFIVIYIIVVFILPGMGVLLSHLGVRKKLCALSLTARAAHGELPLPMPILRRPTHMIIVTGMANGARGVVDDNDSSDDGKPMNDNNGDAADKRKVIETRIRMNPRIPRSIRRAQNQQAVRKSSNGPPELPLPQTSTLRSRRRLANMLVGSALVFIICWSPHVICYLCLEFGATGVCSKGLQQFSLLLGYAHSALSPILYWALNHNSLRQSSCAPFARFSSAQRFIRSHLRVPAAPPPPSSTNEAALGPFNPRYITARPQQYRPPASSHYLY